jgi:hypothetical protein
VVVDWRVLCLAHWSGLNCVHHGGRVPRQSVRLEPQVDTGVSTPRRFRRTGPVAGFQSVGSLASRTKEEDNESSITDGGHPAAGGRLDMNCLGLGRRVLPDRRIHYSWRPVGAHGLPPDVHGPGHLPRGQTGPAPAGSASERAPGRAYPFVRRRSARKAEAL